MFDIGTGELLALAVVALLVLGPEKLPRYAAEAARFLRQLRSLANDARNEVTSELGPEIEGLGLRDINPRALVRKHLLDGSDVLGDDEDDNPTTWRQEPTRARQEGTQPAIPYDPDTT